MAFRLRPKAIADIEAIAAYIHADNPRAAAHWLDEIEQHCAALGQMPGMGVNRPDIGEKTRLFPVGNYLILYQIEPYGVDIVRVVHGRRSPDGWL